jgi:hypothetical protein
LIQEFLGLPGIARHHLFGRKKNIPRFQWERFAMEIHPFLGKYHHFLTIYKWVIIHLIGGFNHFEKYDSQLGVLFSYIMEK